MDTISPLILAAVALLAPAAMALLLAVVYPLRLRGWPAAWLSVLTALTSLAAAATLFVVYDGPAPIESTLTWLVDGNQPLSQVGIHIDATSTAMLLVVTLVASSVQVFSLGYMAEEPRPALGRYFVYHSLFIFSMNLLVLAPDLLQFFLGWELVGLTSYLLIGFYYRKPSAAHAAVKAFWITKFADMGLVMALLVSFLTTGGFSFNTDFSTSASAWAATAVTLLLFLAVMGKSAQFPLHVWLPNAMEGPTPVSALLHAATMVAAGVYLLVRAFPLFAQAPSTLTVLTWVGAFTALFAAVVASVQTDIKRVLAYSTCSQLGYMVAAVGAAAPVAAYFHLTTHAFFKALLFLASGSVIHAVHSNELTEMGGLARKMKVTTAVFIIGALALAGVPGFSGFFSKDLILEHVAEHSGVLPTVFLLVAAGLTAYYMTRTVAMAFFGKASHAAEHAHESGPAMLTPLIVLAVPALGSGWVAAGFAHRLGEHYEFRLSAVGVAATLLGLTGIALGWLIHGSGRLPASRFAFLSPVGVLARSGAVDRTYRFLFTEVALRLANAVGWFDRYIVDGLVNAVGWLGMVTSRRLQRVQTGNVLDYVYALVLGVVALAVWRLWV